MVEEIRAEGIGDVYDKDPEEGDVPLDEENEDLACVFPRDIVFVNTSKKLNKNRDSIAEIHWRISL